MKAIPKYVIKLLQKRMKLANELMEVCADVDEYCEKIGMLPNCDPDETALLTNVMIYCEPTTAYRVTLEAIKDYLVKRGK